MRKYLLLIATALALLPAAAQAQVASGNPVYWTGSRMDAATVVGTSATSAATITVAAVNGAYFVLTGLDIQNCAGSSAVTAAAVTTLTTTNLGGMAYTIGSGVAAGLCQPIQAVSYGPGGIRSSAPGTATTFVLPTFATNQTVRVNVYGYYAQ